MKRYPFLDLATVNAPYMADIESAVCRVIRQGRYIGGSEVEQLEHNLCALTGATHAVAVSNGLDALRLILRAYIQLGRLRPGDEVIVPANTYIASVLAITDAELVPVLAEPDFYTSNLDTSKLASLITPRTQAIMPVHLYGRPCWDTTLIDLSRKHNLLIIEDNAQAIGATSPTAGFGGSHVTGALGHAAAFSFYPTKNIGAMGDAGAVTTDDHELALTVRALANYGSDRRYHNIYAGFNCRMDPIQAALLRVKLPHTAEENDYRRMTAQIYRNGINNKAVRLPVDEPGHVYHQFVVHVANRQHFTDFLDANGIGWDMHYAIPAHRQHCYADLAHQPLPITDLLADTLVSLPITRCTSHTDAREIASIINRYLPPKSPSLI